MENLMKEFEDFKENNYHLSNEHQSLNDNISNVI